jgi:hypothetical protein
MSPPTHLEQAGYQVDWQANSGHGERDEFRVATECRLEDARGKVHDWDDSEHGGGEGAT